MRLTKATNGFITGKTWIDVANKVLKVLDYDEATLISKETAALSVAQRVSRRPIAEVAS